MTVRCSYNGTVSFKFNEKDYEADVFATADYSHEPCVMYFKDGTGQPESDDFELNDVEVSKLRCVDTDENLTEKYDTDKDFKNDVDELIDDVLYDMDYDEWSYPEEPDYEPEFDYEG